MTGVETILDDDSTIEELSSKGYVPEYAPGEIVVQFRRLDSAFDVATFGQIVGYEVIDRDISCGGVSYRTPVGKEKEAIRAMTSYTKFVETAYRYDLKAERRVQALDKVIENLRDLSDHNLSDRRWRREIDRIVGDLTRIL